MRRDIWERRRLARLSVDRVRNMPYVEFVSLINETNRPPGGKHTVRWIAQNSLLSNEHCVLEVGCNTGFSSIEFACLARCQVVGVDPSEAAIRAAKINADKAKVGGRVSFRRGDAKHLPFKDASFDLVMCGGVVAWIKDMKAAVRECRRVLRPWGFLASAPFYYHTLPPRSLLTRLNEVLNVEFRPWQREFWISVFESQEFEFYYAKDVKISAVSNRTLVDYVNYLLGPLERVVRRDVFREIYKKAHMYFSLFNENHKYLSYSILLFRKRPVEEQRSLF